MISVSIFRKPLLEEEYRKICKSESKSGQIACPSVPKKKTYCQYQKEIKRLAIKDKEKGGIIDFNMPTRDIPMFFYSW